MTISPDRSTCADLCTQNTPIKILNTKPDL